MRPNDKKQRPRANGAVVVNFSIPAELAEKLRLLAISEYRSTSQQCAKILEVYFDALDIVNCREYK